MSAGIVTVIIVIAAIVVAAVAAGVLYDGRRRWLRRRFGPEYDRLVDERKSRLKAEAELAGREKRVKGLDIRPLDPAAQRRYADEWASVQELFVDAPQQTVADAQRLVMAVMSERGYPTEDSAQVLADLAVDHASTVDDYRAAYGISQRAAGDIASTEDLRLAMIHYRALFRDLLGQPGRPEGAAPSPEPEREPVVPEREAMVHGKAVIPEQGAGVTDEVPDVHDQVPEEADVPAADLPPQRGR